jgi:hypothetical protein
MTDNKPVKKTKPNVTLKRRVTIRAVVTDKLKEYLRFELSESTRMAEKRNKELDAQLNTSNIPAPMKAQAETEKLQIKQTLSQTDAQLKSIEALEDGALFTQGVIEGFVGISIGDNLYEKLGGMEILIKDGIVENVTPVGNPAI